MDLTTETFDEQALVAEFRQQNIEQFLRFIKKYDAYMRPIMRVRGYEYVKTAERTVAFSFAEITISRCVYRKGQVWRYPVDEKLGLSSHTRFSQEFLYQLTELSALTPYRKVCEVVELLDQIFVTKDTVQKAVNQAGKLLKKRDAYERYGSAHENFPKKRVSVFYIEGDGVMVKTTEGERKATDLAHFVIHTGRENVGKLRDKKEILSASNAEARDQLLDYLYATFEITEETLLITNSDGGHGYTPGVFQEIASLFEIKHHEHFWDAFHVNHKIKEAFSKLPYELESRFFDAMRGHDKRGARLVLDTAESLLEDNTEIEVFTQFRNKILKNFAYTRPAQQRGLFSTVLGVMESQHRKITYRMKHRGMYWSVRGAETMGKLLILKAEHQLRDLFFGRWRGQEQNYENHLLSTPEILKQKTTLSTVKQVKNRLRRWQNYGKN